ncbi:MAG: translation initiation factor IF-2 [Proteobacteria bacterium]|nr:translation initiation factor IF-2 [Pseudomonadota bacterium]
MQGRQSIGDGAAGDVAGKVRIYEIAKEIGLANKELVDKLRTLGIDVRNHMSMIDIEEVQRIKRALEKERAETREVQRLGATVLRRRSKGPIDPPVVVAAPGEAHVPLATLPSTVVAVAAPAAEPEEREGAPTAELSAAAPPALEVETSSEPVVGASAPEETSAAPVAVPAETAAASPASAPAAAPLAARAPGTATEGGPTAGGLTGGGPTGGGPTGGGPTGRNIVEVTPPPRREIRFAPGYGPNARPATPAAHSPAVADAVRPQVSAAEAAKMLVPGGMRRPKVVITDLDTIRRDAGRKDLFQDRRKAAALRARKKRPTAVRKGKKTEITMPAEHKRVIRVEDAITVGEMARQMGVKATEVLKKLWAEGMTNVTINQSIDADTASIIASGFGYEVEDVAFREEHVLQGVEDSSDDLQPRAPVVTVMGHVDHGKTSLLDAVRGARVAAGEAGGITQHMGAYRVQTPRGDIVFLDTPGHEAFTQMRARGAQCTDIVVLVVAADDGVMPQTLEALDHARDAGVPIVVALNKIDRANANPERVRTQLGERNLIPEEWGGETIFVEVSAHTKQGIDRLLESLLLQAELLELRANPSKHAIGTVVEARMDRARGAMCTVLVQEGTLRVGEVVVAGEHIGKVRALLDDRGNSLEFAGPSTPVEVLGMGGVPEAGDDFNALVDEKAARQLAEFRHGQARRKELGNASAKTTYEEILGKIQSGAGQDLKLLIKADVHGSAQAVRDAVSKLATEKVAVNVISAGVGGIHETDVNLAKAAGAVILGFSVRPAGKASQLAEREGVEIRIYDIIYELLDDVKGLMRGLLPKQRTEKPMGRAEVRETFTIPRLGTIAGCGVLEGKVTRSAHVRVIRESVKVYDGRIGSLRRFKDDVREVAQGYECGLSIDGYNEIKPGDGLEFYEIEESAPEL